MADKFVPGHLWTKVSGILGARHQNQDVAIDHALEILRTGDVKKSLSRLEYAQRLFPSDTAVSFAIGLLRMEIGDPRAVEPLELVANRTQWRDAILHLAIARMRAGQIDGAAAELHRTLRMNAPSKEPGSIRLANQIAEETKSFGWCGLCNAGKLVVGGNAQKLPDEDLSIRIDGRKAGFHSDLRAPRDARVLLLDKGWENAHQIEISVKGRPLIGSPIQVAQVTRVEGFIAAESGGLRGWCWLPGEREMTPPIEVSSVSDSKRRLKRVARSFYNGPGIFPDMAVPRGFSITFEELAKFDGPVKVTTIHQRLLYGSPLDPRQTILSAQASAAAIALMFPANDGGSLTPALALREPSIPVEIVGPKRTHPKPVQPRPVDVVIPVYRGLKVTLDCIESVLIGRSLPEERIVVVVDASPEPDLVSRLEKMAAKGRIILSLQTVNRGFPATANIGLRMAAGRDAVLLNSDTLVPPGWLAKLQAAVYSAEDIGTATPLSNDATIFSYPQTDIANPPLDLETVRQTSALAASVNGETLVDVPTGHGFCMYIRRECLDDAGVLREDVFGHGYGEENDLCMRARVLGWRHVAVPGLYVGHVGSQSFSTAKTHLIHRNAEIINRLHVGYDQMIQKWIARDPLAVHRRRLDIARFQEALGARRTIALITHDRAGGVLKHVTERALSYEASGDCAVILRPGRDQQGKTVCLIELMTADAYPNLKFLIPDEDSALTDFLKAARLQKVEFHHFIGHDSSIFKWAVSLGIAYEVFIHDYSWYCPRVTLTNGANRFCGEPIVDRCITCVADYGSNIDEKISPVELRARSIEFLKGAHRVIAASKDVTQRIQRQLGINAVIGSWEREQPLQLRLLDSSHGGKRRVCIVGAIGYEKGYEVILEIGRLISAQKLPLEIIIVGYTCDDQRLLETDAVTITGRYDESEVIDLIRAQRADFGFLPALWPETWSYTLSQMWEANLPVIAYDIGAQAERIQSRQGGIVVPLHIPTPKLVEIFLRIDLFPAI